MKKPIVVWVVDDLHEALEAAANCVKEAGEEMGLSLSLFQVKSLAWSGHPKEELPKLVVLDLMQDGAPLGISFYEELRAAEKADQREATRAFVIIWSDYISTGDRPRGFAATHAAMDGRLINLNLGYKSPGSIAGLREKIRGALGRILDEDLCSLQIENLENLG